LIRSRDNPQVKRWARLARDGRARRDEGRAIIEGPHLLASLRASGGIPAAVLVTEEALARDEIRRIVHESGRPPVLLSAAAFRSIADAESPQGLAAEIAIPAPRLLVKGDCAFLEGVQDAGNLGAILRSAAAFGVAGAVLDRACADPWSPKVLRAAMGGHFVLSLQQVPELADALEGFSGSLACTVPSGGSALRSLRLPDRVGWIFGSEGAGVSTALRARAALQVSIATAPGTESLNVAAAAAVCFYERFSRPGAGS
jgi:TrmH family RNA methyltransferase